MQTPTQGGVRATPQNLVDFVDRIDDLPVPPAEVVVNVTAMGSTQLPITAMGVAMGLNVRVGMEDNVFFRKDELLQSNAQLVERTVRIATELERPPATADQARAMLGIPARRQLGR